MEILPTWKPNININSLYYFIKQYFDERCTITAITCYAIGNGIAGGIISGILPYQQIYYNMNYTLVGFYMLTMGLSSFVSIFAFHYFSHNYLSSAYFLLLGSLILAIAMFLTCYLEGIFILFIGSVLSGIGLCWSDLSINIQTVLFEKKMNKNRMGWLKFVNSIGGIIGVSIMGAVIQHKIDLFSFGLGLMSFFTISSLIIFNWLIFEADEIECKDGAVSLLSYKPLLPGSIIVLLASIINSSIIDWITIYYSIVLQSPPFVSTIGLTVYKFAVAFGKFPIDYLGKKYSSINIILISSITSAIGLSIVVACPSLETGTVQITLTTIGMSITALGVSSIRPLILSEIKNYNLDISSVKAVTFITYFGIAGVLLSKPIMASIATQFDLRVAFGFNIFLSVILFIYQYSITSNTN